MPRIAQPGAANLELPKVIGAGRTPPIVADGYHWLLSTSWTLALAGMIGAFFATNALFAILYLLGADPIANGRPGSYADAFYFSVQTMSGVGYGYLYPQTDFASALASIEAGLGLMGVAMATGLIFAKVSRPTARVLFSTHAVIHDRDGVPHLHFRMANARNNLVVQARVTVVILLDEVTSEGHKMRRLHDLALVRHESPMFALSMTAMHPIVPGSPLYGIDPETFRKSNAMIMCSLSGIDDTFSATIQARYRYKAEDVHWDASFVDMFVKVNGKVSVIDLQRLSLIQPTATAAAAQEA